MNACVKVLLISAITISTILDGIYFMREQVQNGVFSFLSLTRPISAEVLVIEGWLSGRMFEEAAVEFLRGKYSYCLVSGRAYSSLSPAEAFMRHGIDPDAIKYTNAMTGNGHNTYHIALAARQWLQVNDAKVSRVNIFTAGPHGRKSWTIVKRAFGPEYSVGVVSSSINPSDTDLWWGSEHGARTLIKYGIGYLYALFWPFEKTY